MKNMRKLWGILAIVGGLGLLVVVQAVLLQRGLLVMAVAERSASSMIAVDPAVLQSVQPANSLVSQTLTIQNLGDADLDWHVFDELELLWDQTDNASSMNGAPSQYFPDVPGGGYAADDFVVPAGQTWQVDQIFVPGSYTPGAGPAPDFEVTVYNDNGGLPDTIVVSATAVTPLSDVKGDATLIMNPPVTLTAGSYWLVVNANMNFEGPPKQWFWTARTVQTGSPYQWMETGMFGTSCTGGWQAGAAVCGVGSGVDPDLAFALSSRPEGNCQPLSVLPWVAVSPLSGTVAVSSTLPVTVAFDSSGYVPGIYTATLCIASNDPLHPLLPVPLTMTVSVPVFGVAVAPDDSGGNLPGTTVHYALSVTNIGSMADVYTLTASSIWTTTLSVNSIALAGGTSGKVAVTVTVPSAALLGEMDTAVITATSQSDSNIAGSATLTTTAAIPKTITTYLPFIKKSE